MAITAHDHMRQAKLYLCTDAREHQGDLPDFLDAVLGNGVDVVQLRQKGLEARAELAYLEIFADAAARHGKLFAVNDRADIAYAAEAPILHLGQDDLPVRIARKIVGTNMIIGRSSHSPAQFDLGYAEDGVDYVVAGPTWATPTKPGRPAAGPSLLSHAAAVNASAEASLRASTRAFADGSARQAFSDASRETARAAPAVTPDGVRAEGLIRPWWAIGGIESLERLDHVIALGARRVVVVRALTEASDPGAAAQQFASRLAAVPQPL